ncbi:MAG: RNA-directed DNA polymerase [Candidatus Peribacteria bacterium]|nr:MAG: RNA-directed DNA polymerase [Candidatus Peribacteria bacterium]
MGNLTSQLFANVYMNSFDHQMQYHIGCKHYGRYVDDFVVIHQDRQFLVDLIPRITSRLIAHLGLTLHPHKIYLQHYTR